MSTRALGLILLFATPAVFAQQPAAASDYGTILVWRVGSPYTGETPDTNVAYNVQAAAATIGSSIRVESFPARGFAQTLFSAMETHQEPDVITFDNHAILTGATTPLGTFVGIQSNADVSSSLIEVTNSLANLAGQRQGWQYLISNSPNHEAARLLALQSPECVANAMPGDLQPIARRISDAYLEQAVALKADNDPDRLLAGGTRTGPLHVMETTTCRYFGNKRLAFISLISSYTTPTTIGQMPVTLVLRRQNEKVPWRLLVGSTDSMTNGLFTSYLPQVAGKLSKTLDTVEKPNAAEILSPEAGINVNKTGTFTWQPSTSKDVIAEIAEFAYQHDARLFVRFDAGTRTPETLSGGQLWTTNSEWQWRIWSISKDGTVVFSDSRTFPH
jgi:hypothetical protein